MENDRYIEADDYYDMGIGWLRNKNRAKAEECLLKTIELNPYFIYAYIDLAGLYARLGRYKDAVHVLKNATIHDPTFDRLHHLMARYACKNEDYANAAIFIDRAIEINPVDAHVALREAIMQRYRDRRR